MREAGEKTGRAMKGEYDQYASYWGRKMTQQKLGGGDDGGTHL